MKVNLVHTAAEIEQPLQNQEKPDLSRRALLSWLPILGVGCAAAMTLGVSEAGATPVTDAASKPKLADDELLAEGKRAELVGDPDDAIEISAQTRGMVRRGARRTVRRTRRTARRVRRRVR
jgi:hypothetical protein